jgi:hypothetical protein
MVKNHRAGGGHLQKDGDMKVPVPYKYNGSIVVDIEFGRPKGGLIAEVKRAAESSGPYQAILTFLAGAITEITMMDGGILSGASLKAAVRDMPYVTADWASMQVLIMAGADDQVDPYHVCTKCRKPFPENAFEDDPIRVRDLPVAEAWDVSQPIVETIIVQLGFPVEFKNKKTGETIETVEAIEVHLPTLGDCISAYKSKGGEDGTALQYAVMLRAIERVNGIEATQKWKAEIGELLFEKMDSMDISAIAKTTRKYGMTTSIERRCPNCGRMQKIEVPTQDFFASGLRGDK